MTESRRREHSLLPTAPLTATAPTSHPRNTIDAAENGFAVVGSRSRSLAAAVAIDAVIARAIGAALNEWGHPQGLPPLQWRVAHQDGCETIEGFAAGSRADRRRSVAAWADAMGLSRHGETSPWFLDADGWHIEITTALPRSTGTDDDPATHANTRALPWPS